MTDPAPLTRPPQDRPVSELLAQIRQGGAQELGHLLRLYESYLHVLASAQLDARLRRRVSPSDLVQETMLGAYRDFPQFRGRSERELLGWLRQILINCLRRAYRTHLRADRRDVRREVSFEEIGKALNQSAVNLANVLVDRGSSPSGHMSERERAVELANRLATLRPEYREVIVLRSLQGLSFDEVAARLDKRPGAVRMLWLRAIEKFRQSFEAAK